MINIGDQKLREIMVVAFSVISVVVIVLISGLYVINSYESNRGRLLNSISNKSEIIAIRTDGYIRERISSLKAAIMTQSESINSDYKQDRHFALTNILASHPGIRSVWAISSYGKVRDLVSRFDIETKDQIDRVQEINDEITKKRNGVYFGNIRFTELSQEPVVDISIPSSYPYADEHSRVGATFSLKYLWDLLERYNIETDLSAYAYSRDGRLIGHSDRSLVFYENKIPSEIIEDIFASNETTWYEFYDNKGSGRIIGVSFIDSIDIPIMVETAMAEAYDPIFLGIYWAVLVALFVFLISVFLAWIISGFILHPIIALSDTVEEITENNVVSTLELSGTVETRRLGVAFNKMILSLADAIKKLQVSEERFKNMFQQASVCVWDMDFSETYAEVKKITAENVNDLRVCLRENSSKVEKLLGLVNINNVNQAGLDILKSSNIQQLRIYVGDQLMLSASEGAINMLCSLWEGTGKFESEFTFIDMDGRELHTIVSFMLPEMKEGFSNVPVSIIDITELKVMQRQLSHSQKYNRTLFEQSPIGLALCRMDGTLVDVNKAYADIIGYSVEEALKLTYWDITPRDYEAQEAMQIQSLEVSGKYGPYEKEYIHRNGHRIPVLLNGMLIEQDKENYIWSSVENLSDRRAIEDHLRHAHKMEAVGTLAGGVAHDFNNILGIILGNTELISMGIGDQGEHEENLKRACARGSSLVKQLMTLSRSEEGAEKVPVETSSIIKEALKLLRSTLPASIEIIGTLEDKDKTVLADPTQVSQIIMNLCTNGGHAIGESGGVLTVEQKSVVIEEERARLLSIAPGEYMEIMVRDTGEGIPDEIKERIFNPFFTTKEISKGTGLGLSVVHGIVKDSAGAIHVDTQVGKGTTFFVYLPIIKSSESMEAEGDYQEVEDNIGQGSILFVDDEGSLVDVGTQMLSAHGYTCKGYTDPEKALAEFKNNPEAFDAVVSDQLMPGLNGTEMAIEMLSLKPNMPIYLCTGFSETLTEKVAHKIGAKMLLHKPVNYSELLVHLKKDMETNS